MLSWTNLSGRTRTGFEGHVIFTSRYEMVKVETENVLCSNESMKPNLRK
jgi:hypothetical protein